MCTCRLSKELQQKDKIIESLHSKLQQRPETPSSCHALSETTDQSDRTSLVSDEYRTTEDLELCSDVDIREHQEEHRLQHTGPGSEQSGIDCVFSSSFCDMFPSIISPSSSPLVVYPSYPPHRPLKSSSSCPNMLYSASLGCFAGGMGHTGGYDLQSTKYKYIILLQVLDLLSNPVILNLQPFSMSLSPPPSLSPLALTGVRRSPQGLGPGPCLSSLFGLNWMFCTNR